MRRSQLMALLGALAIGCVGAGPISLRLTEVTQGKTTIGDVYWGDRALVGFLDPESSRLYVADGEADRVRRVLAAEIAADGVWIIPRAGAARRFSLAPLVTLDRSRLLRVGQVAVVKDYDCVLVTKSRCINVRDRQGNFLYAWRAVADLHASLSDAGKACQELVQTNTLDVYAEPDCRGESRREDRTLAFCTPP